MVPEKQGVLIRLRFFGSLQERIQHRAFAHAPGACSQLFFVQRQRFFIDDIVCQGSPVLFIIESIKAVEEQEIRILFGDRLKQFFLLFGTDRQISGSVLQFAESFRDLIVVRGVDRCVLFLIVQVGVKVGVPPVFGASGTDQEIHPVRLILRSLIDAVQNLKQSPGTFTAVRLKVTAAKIHKKGVIRVLLFLRIILGFSGTAVIGAGITAATAAARRSCGTAAAASGRCRHELQDPFRDPYGQVLGAGPAAAGLIGRIYISRSQARLCGIRDVRVRHKSPDGVKG